MKELYSFGELHKFLDERGFPKVKQEPFKIIKEDFTKAYQDGKIKFTDDGIYYDDEKIERKGYMYMPTYRVKKYDSFSRIHLVKCSVIQDFMDNGMFGAYYVFSNNKTNDITDRDTKEEYPYQVLNVCSKCKKELNNGVETSKDFFGTLDKKDIQKNEIKVDINGYTFDFPRISKEYRESKNYTCEECGKKPKTWYDNEYWHTHHINLDKTNNSPDNLKCLCIKCHSEVDKHHQKQFKDSIYLKQFKKKYCEKVEKGLEENKKEEIESFHTEVVEQPNIDKKETKEAIKEVETTTNYDEVDDTKQIDNIRESPYIIDTNVFIDEPKILDHIDENHDIILPFTVVDELDRLKGNKRKLKTEIKVSNVRWAISNIENSKRDIKFKPSNLVVLPPDFRRDSPDNRILSIAYQYKDKKGVLITTDRGFALKAKALGIKHITLLEFKQKNNIKNSPNVRQRTKLRGLKIKGKIDMSKFMKNKNT